MEYDRKTKKMNGAGAGAGRGGLCFTVFHPCASRAPVAERGWDFHLCPVGMRLRVTYCIVFIHTLTGPRSSRGHEAHTVIPGDKTTQHSRTPREPTREKIDLEQRQHTLIGQQPTQKGQTRNTPSSPSSGLVLQHHTCRRCVRGKKIGRIRIQSGAGRQPLSCPRLQQESLRQERVGTPIAYELHTD